MARGRGLMLLVLFGFVMAIALCAVPARAETDGDMFDPANYNALKDDPKYGAMIREYHDRSIKAAEEAARVARRSNLPKKGFLLREGDRLVCAGDSITAAQGGYVDILRNLITAAYPDRKIEVINAGISGNKVTDLLARTDKDIIDQKPDWVTISIGINDVWHGEKGVPLDEYIKKLDELVTKLVNAKINVVMLTTTVIGEDPSTDNNKKLVAYNVAIKEVARTHGLMVVPMNVAFTTAIAQGHKADPGFKLTNDGVHPNAVGHSVMALTILRALRFQEPER